MNVANVVSLSRGLLAVVLLLLYCAGAPDEVLVFCAVTMWLTDGVDGWIARNYGSRPSGKIVDPLMDDLALLAGFLILLDLSAVPLWFVAFLFASRVLFSLVRAVGQQQSGQFAGSRTVTKLSGACLAVGQCLLLAGIGISDQVVVYIMTIVLCASMYVFLIRQHGRLLLGLIKQDQQN